MLALRAGPKRSVSSGFRIVRRLHLLCPGPHRCSPGHQVAVGIANLYRGRPQCVELVGKAVGKVQQGRASEARAQGGAAGRQSDASWLGRNACSGAPREGLLHCRTYIVMHVFKYVHAEHRVVFPLLLPEEAATTPGTPGVLHREKTEPVPTAATPSADSPNAALAGRCCVSNATVLPLMLTSPRATRAELVKVTRGCGFEGRGRRRKPA